MVIGYFYDFIRSSTVSLNPTVTVVCIISGSGWRIDLDTPERDWQPTGEMIYPRAHFHLVPWTDGLVAAVGKLQQLFFIRARSN